MSNEVKGVSPEELNVIQNYIEQCITQHMTLNEIKNTLLVKAGISPDFTEFAWKNLEQANPEFFKAYNFRLLVKDQIVKFNRLLERQAELMSQLSISPPNTIQVPNGSDIPQKNMPMTPISNMGLVQGTNGEMTKPETVDINGSHFMFGPNGVQGRNGEMMKLETGDIKGSHFMFGPDGVQGMNGQMMKLETGDINGSHFMFGPDGVQGMNGEMMKLETGDIKGSHFMFGPDGVQGMNGEMMKPETGDINGSHFMFGPNGVQGMSGEMMKPETGDINGSHFMFGPNGELFDASHAAVEMPVSSYSSVESQSQPINNNTLLGENAAYENVGQIPRSLSHSDLTANFSPSSDILEGHSASPFLATGSNNLLNPQYGVEQQDNRRLETISEGLSYDNFGSNLEISDKKKSE